MFVSRLLAPIALLAAALAATPAPAFETVTFPSAGGLEVTADLYRPAEPAKAAIVLFHMARASRGEYREIAPRLAKLGYAALAVDLRSGGAFDGVRNETAARAGVDPGYMAAIPDIEAAVAWARTHLGVSRIGIMGSSYSASLVLVLAGTKPGLADVAIAFSPGEYFSEPGYVSRAAAGIRIPVFVTGAQGETPNWRPIFDAIPGTDKTGFQPPVPGHHGATALVADTTGAYWKALEAFLARYLPAR
jgi:dienelactone hydrolase